MDNIGTAFEMMAKQDISDNSGIKLNDRVLIHNPDYYCGQIAVVAGFEQNMFNRPLVRVNLGKNRSTVFYPYELEVIP